MSDENRTDSGNGKGPHGEKAAMYDALLRNISDLAYICDGEGNILYVNEAFERLSGRRPEDFLGKSFAPLFDEENLARARDVYGRTLEGESPSYDLTFKDTGIVCAFKNIPYRDLEGNIIGVLGTARDITMARRVERALKASRSKYRALFDNMLDGAAYHEMVLDDGGRPVDYVFLEVNKAFEQHTGLRKEDVVGRRVTTVIPGIRDTEPDLIEVYGRVATTGEGCSFTTWVEQLKRWYFVSAYCPEKGFFVSIFHDITEIKKAEEELRRAKDELEAKIAGRTMELAEANRVLRAENLERRKKEEELRASEDRFNAAQEVADIGSWERDIVTGELTWSENIYRLMGLEPFELTPSFDIFLAFVHPDDRERVLKGVEEAGRRGGRYDVEYRLIRKDGVERVMRSLGRFEYDEKGRPVYIRGVGQDITELRKAEAEKQRLSDQLVQSQKMEAVGTLAGGIAHDFNNIMTAIKNLTHLAIEEVGEHSYLREYLDPLRSVTEKATNLVQQLLIFSRSKPLETASIDLGRAVDEVLDMLRSLVPEDIHIEKDIEEGLWGVMAEKGRIEQVITNLVINGRDAMPGGGRLAVKAANVTVTDEGGRAVHGARAGDFVRLSVEDTGEGMDTETMGHIFEPFFTTKSPSGSGLGLSVVYGIVKELKGWIGVESTPGNGARFNVFLPASTEAVAAVEEPVEKAPGKAREETARSWTGKDILLVEDEKWVRMSTAMILEEYGYRVTEAADAEEAIAVFRRDGRRFDLVLSDVVMPGKSGLEMAKTLVEMYADVPVLFFSGYLEDQGQLREITRRGFACVQKPYEIEDLLNAVKECIR